MMERQVKPSNQRAKRALEKRAPKLVENPKSLLTLKGQKTSEIVSEALKDLHILKKPDAVAFSRKNALFPFKDQNSLEFFCRQNDCSLFAFGSHSKKRPHNLILGRCYNFQVLHMYEFGIAPDTFASTASFSAARAAVAPGMRPCFVFRGEEFESVPQFVALKSFLLGEELESVPQFVALKSFLLDFFRGQSVPSINLAGLKRVITVSVVDGPLAGGKKKRKKSGGEPSTSSDEQAANPMHGKRIEFRHYAITLKKSGSKEEEEQAANPMHGKRIEFRHYAITLEKSGTKVPKIHLDEVGPTMDLIPRRTHAAAKEIQKASMRRPAQLKARNEKNVSTGDLGHKMGRIHMHRQNLTKIALKKQRGHSYKRQKLASGKAKATKAATSDAE